ncbi:hypothetical protein [Thermodesulfatator autotrophicus]|uniref:Uncharacterized protein n=1 Tax=Thermodesulfatator autotrophicus TaxID=1795632 RepID=A0A177E9M0_9BACT|nr:hypothetical protein [Thermodesulfatator autotrophicus]OAG28647.1 hypothetical protein TH606_00675 [Thermodesulfatator autotrophicus]
MPEEEKNLENKPPEEEQDDPLAELLIEDEEGEVSPSETSAAETDEAKDSEAIKEEPDKKLDVEKEKNTGEDGAPLPGEDPLASLLDEELLEEEDTSESEKDSSQEGDSKDKDEKDEPEDKDEEEQASKLGIVWLVLAILIPAILLASGVFTFLKLYQQPLVTIPEKEPAKPETPPPKAEKQVPLVASPIAVESQKMLLLKNFLIPYQKNSGENVFVKAKVILYFANKRDYEMAKRNELLLREHLYRLLRNVPLYVWENPQGEKIIKKEFLNYLTKKKIADVVPIDVKVSGYILK